MPYLSNSESDFRAMLDVIGVKDFEELISNIPEKLRFKRKLKIPSAVSEFETRKILEEIAADNKTYTSFLGGGVYDHYIPAAINSIISRPEFYTSYTPYQPEVSQGNLQVMYEFQSLICELTGMDMTNASIYDAGSALGEAVLTAATQTRRNKILMPETVNWRYKEIAETYSKHLGIEIVSIPHDNFTLDKDELKNNFDESTAAIVVQHPNYFGFLEDIENITALRGSDKALLIQVYDPISLGLLKTPGEFGMDMAVAEGQVLGNAQNFGGPFLGLFSVTEKLVRKMPGRLAGITKDTEGKRGFVMTLQTREQHIRRDKATSNICTNSGLLTVAASVYLSLLGKKGIQEAANLSLQKAHYLADQLAQINGVTVIPGKHFFKEFTIELPVPAQTVIKKAMEKGIFAGISLERYGYPNNLLIAVTEKRAIAEIDTYTELLKSIIQ